MLNVYKQILDFNKIDYVDLDINEKKFWTDLRTCDLFLAKFSQVDDDLNLMTQILPIISVFMGIKCFPSYNTAWHYDDKVKQYYLLSQFDFPLAESYIFWDKLLALKWAADAEYPVVFKLKGGAGSSNVALIKGKTQAKKIINKSFSHGIHPHWFDVKGKIKSFNYDLIKIAKYFGKPYLRQLKGLNSYSNYTVQKNYVYFQKFLPNNEYDTRVAIVGERAWAFKRFNRKNDFRASGSNMYDIRKEEIDKEMIKIAFTVSRTMKFQSMAYDFVYDENNKPVIVEVSYTYGDYPEFSDGYWDERLEWHDGQYVPEFLELVDALNIPGLKQPPIELDSPYKKALMKK